MRLSELARGLPLSPDDVDPEITGITEDSRRIRRGMLFVAVPGSALDGHAYIPHAISQGAEAVVVERAGAVPPGVPCIRVPSARIALADLLKQNILGFWMCHSGACVCAMVDDE